MLFVVVKEVSIQYAVVIGIVRCWAALWIIFLHIYPVLIIFWYIYCLFLIDISEVSGNDILVNLLFE